MTDAIRRALERVDRAAVYAPPSAGLDRLSTWLRRGLDLPQEHRGAAVAVALELVGDQAAHEREERARHHREARAAVSDKAMPPEPMDAYPLEELCRCGHAWAGHDSLPPHECMADGYRCPDGTCTVFRPQRSAPPPRAHTYGVSEPCPACAAGQLDGHHYRTGRNPLDRCGLAGGVGDPS